ncbi:MAG TPA: hypothetical protein DEB39_01225 [Planctomycetaceae bacterium]|nr:hypothetical protein [Planctomycetaceae bacterium]
MNVYRQRHRVAGISVRRYAFAGYRGKNRLPPDGRPKRAFSFCLKIAIDSGRKIDYLFAISRVAVSTVHRLCGVRKEVNRKKRTRIRE